MTIRYTIGQACNRYEPAYSRQAMKVCVGSFTQLHNWDLCVTQSHSQSSILTVPQRHAADGKGKPEEELGFRPVQKLPNGGDNAGFCERQFLPVREPQN